MNKWDLITKMSEKTGLRRSEVERALGYFVELVAETLQQGEKVSIAKLGTFKVIHKKSREARNPATGEKIITKAGRVPKFVAAKALKADVSGLQT
jgi:DNA-binding protein HU-beta